MARHPWFDEYCPDYDPDVFRRTKHLTVVWHVDVTTGTVFKDHYRPKSNRDYNDLITHSSKFSFLNYWKARGFSAFVKEKLEKGELP